MSIKAPQHHASIFYCPTLATIEKNGELSESETRHAAAARRLRVGDTIRLFDGCGINATATITAQGGRQPLQFEIVERLQSPGPAIRLWLACAIPKGDRQSVLLDMVTQLGVSHIVPVIFERSVWRQTEIPARWSRVIIEASKQCGRSWLPMIHPPCVLDELANTFADVKKIFVAHQFATAEEQIAVAADSGLVVGPEGGLTDSEFEQLIESGATPVRLGLNTLRTETAAAALVAVVGSRASA